MADKSRARQRMHGLITGPPSTAARDLQLHQLQQQLQQTLAATPGVVDWLHCADLGVAAHAAAAATSYETMASAKPKPFRGYATYPYETMDSAKPKPFAKPKPPTTLDDHGSIYPYGTMAPAKKPPPHAKPKPFPPHGLPGDNAAG